MHKRSLGPYKAGAIGFGTMSFGGMYGPTDEAESFAALDTALELGMTHLDTANIYGMGVSETVIGNWLRARRIGADAGLVIATKASIIPGPPRLIDNSEAGLRAELEGSLRRLGRDHVELFYIHRREAQRPLEEVIGTLSRLIEEGKIGGYGLSEVAPTTLRRAHSIHPCTAVQNEYSLWTRLPELGIIQACAELGVAFVPFSPLGRGMFGDQPLAPPQDAFRKGNPRFTPENFAANSAVIAGFRSWCQARGQSTAAVSLAWILAQGPHLIPIPGSRSATKLRACAEGASLTLSPADLAEIARLLPPGFAAGDRYNESQMQSVERYC